MKIEVEARSFLTKKQWLALRRFFDGQAKFLGEGFDETVYFSAPKDLRTRRDNRAAYLILKGGKIHDAHREEIEIIFPKRNAAYPMPPRRIMRSPKTMKRTFFLISPRIISVISVAPILSSTASSDADSMRSCDPSLAGESSGPPETSVIQQGACASIQLFVLRSISQAQSSSRNPW